MKTLIVYSTKHGCAEKVAGMLKAKLGGQVVQVNIMKDKAPSIDEFDYVILGGSIYMGRIQKQLTSYVSENLPQLQKKKVGLFVCAGSPDVAARVKELESSFPAELISNAAAKEVLGYELCFEKLGFFEKIIMRAVKGDKNNISEFFEDRMDNLVNVI